MYRQLRLSGAIAAPISLVLLASPLPADVVLVEVRVENLAPAGGTFLTPVWVAFHDGGFDLYDPGAPSSEALERLAEDGATDPLATLFATSGSGFIQATLVADEGIPPIAPGGFATRRFLLDTSLESSRWFSYASMVVPSNDAFIGNGNPLMNEIVDGDGTFLGLDLTVMGTSVRDAGTEVNDEIPMNTAFFGQTTPNTGVDENGVVMTHPGFNPVGSGGILDSAMFANADFTQPGYAMARITVRQATRVRVQVENLAPEFGTSLTPVWIGFHDGTFDTYDNGAPASMQLERLAEDGTTGPLSELFASDVPDGLDATIVADVGIPVIVPGGTGTADFVLSGGPVQRYFSYASMVVPSNDAFVANGNPVAFPIFDEVGGFIGAEFTLPGSIVNDAGTEINDEIPMNTAFFGQTMPNTGVDENGVVLAHPGFNPVGSSGILDAPMFAAADFTQPGYQLGRIVILELDPFDVDLDGDGVVGGRDLGALLAAWGPNGGSPADFNADGVVDGADLAELLARWGSAG